MSRVSNKHTKTLSVRGALRVTGRPFIDDFVARFVDRVFALDRLDTLYESLGHPQEAEAFVSKALEALGVRYDFDPEELGSIPESGPVVIVANHPFGAAEALMIADCVLARRGDLKILANSLLQRLPELDPLIIGVDPFETREASRRNLQPLREAIKWVELGGSLLVFPSGEVSHFRIRERRITDPAWKPSAANIARRASAPVVPIFVEGRNSLLFQVVGYMHPRLRTAMLPRELLNKSRKTVSLRIGAPVNAARLKGFASSSESINYLRARTYVLGDLSRGDRRSEGRQPSRDDFRDRPLDAPIPGHVLKEEFDALPDEQKLVRLGSLTAAYASAEQIPSTLRELGRLRELTFRQVGEGTGKSSDLDRFDHDYLHLYLWCADRHEIIGAYRFALVDETLSQFGKNGLYTYTLFKYRRHFLDELKNGIELGRSFVRPEDQRSHIPLMLLWKGIGKFVGMHPRYHRLFGPVSISNDYHPISRQFMVDYLLTNNSRSKLSRHVKPRSEFRPSHGLSRTSRELIRMGGLDTVSDIIGQIEHGERGVPILLRQYLKLGGLLLGFNVDPAFNQALDGLIMVDLTETSPKVLRRYMGKSESEKFFAHHAGGTTLKKAS
jgi:putative hemolysin